MRKKGANFRGKRAAISPALKIASMCDISDRAKNTLAIQAWQALDAMKMGRGDEYQFSALACTVNVVAVLAQDGYGKEYADEILLAMQALVRISQRGKDHGKWVGDGIGYQEIARAIEIHEQQMEVVTGRKMIEAVERIDRALKGQASKLFEF